MTCRFLCICLALLPLAGCSGPQPAAVAVYAAASTRDALEAIAGDFRQRTGVSIELNSGPSSTLAKQIEQGGKADLFLSADRPWVAYLAERHLVAQQQDLLTNRLVVVVPARSTLQLRQLTDLDRLEVRRLAVAGPAVPAGRYAREALRQAGTWERLQARVVDGGDVRAVLAFVARAEAEAGFVYATDAAGSSQVRVALEVPPEMHSAIRYPLVLLRQPALRPEARQFFEYLRSEAAAVVFRRAGFGIAGDEARTATRAAKRGD